MKTFVTVRYRISGIHRWEGAGNYLQYPHRHEFHFTIWLEVFHDDREVEFIALKEELARFTKYRMSPDWGKSELGGCFSCEMLAESVVLYLQQNYPGRGVRAWVEEDGENGAVVEAVG